MIALNDLVIFSIYFLSQIAREINTEDVVAACYLLFPKRFALRGYPDWPDASVVAKRWIDSFWLSRAFISFEKQGTVPIFYAQCSHYLFYH